MKTSGSKDIDAATKTKVAQFLIEHTKNGKAPAGKLSEAATSFGVTLRSVKGIWAATTKMTSVGNAVIFKKLRIDIKRKKTKVLDIELLKSLPFKKRSTYRRIAKELGVSKSLVGKWVKEKLTRAHTNAIKSDLTAQNKLLRLRFCLSALEFDRAHNIIKFEGMHNTIHIDEKWFYITKTSDRYYLLPDEQEHYRSCKSKKFITKLMFMCAVARPRCAVGGECIFYGKIDLFPLIRKEPALRNNKNKANGTLETKPIDVITKEVIKECLIHQIIPAIKSKWPTDASKEIFIQQDNARPHINNHDIEFKAAATSEGFNIQLVCQPANSPDTNINDLVFFRAIQSLQEVTSSYNVDDLVRNVIISYEKLTHITLNNVFLSLQNCMNEVMKCKCHNYYKVPHMNKSRLIREGTLPVSIQVDEGLVKECIDFLRQPKNDIPSSYDVDTLISELGY